MSDTHIAISEDSCWHGNLIRLRATEPSDWEAFVTWNGEDATGRNLDFLRFPQSGEATRHWVAELSARRPTSDDYTLLMENREGVIVGGIATHDCDRRVGTWSYGLNVRAGFRQRGYAAEAVVLLARYMFEELRYQKCTVQVYDFNVPSIRLHERLGFQREGQLRRMGFTEGRHFDVLVYGLTVEEFTARYGAADGTQ